MFAENIRHHFVNGQSDIYSMFAFAAFLNALDVASDCSQSSEMRKFYYGIEESRLNKNIEYKVNTIFESALENVCKEISKYNENSMILLCKDNISNFIKQTKMNISIVIKYYKNEAIESYNCEDKYIEMAYVGFV
jgi:hypothetical protein